jgi:error-prone DNA polymerase
VRVLPIDVQRSGWECRVTGDGAVLLGLRFVKGLREGAAQRIQAAAPFASLGDLAHRTGLERDELERLAEIGACADLDRDRRAALWQVAAIERGLFGRTTPTSPSPLREMSPWERTVADYRGTGLTTGEHPMAHLRAGLAHRGVRRASELRGLPDGAWVRTAGVVIVRQRPGTAKGLLFLTLEDETGTANAIVTPEQLRRHRACLHGAGLLLVEGRLQNRDGVVHVRAQRFEPLDAEELRRALPASHDFR